jgi:hypothetical protein
MIHMVNGHVMSVVVDDDAERRKSNGLLGVQVHVGPPMKIEIPEFPAQEAGSQGCAQA